MNKSYTNKSYTNKSHGNKIVVYFLLVILFLQLPGGFVFGNVKDDGSVPSSAVAIQSFPVLSASTAIVFNKNTGEVINGKEIHTKRPMGSISKLMTAIVAVDHGNLSDIVTVSSYAASMGGTSAGLKAGDRVTLEDLIFAMILPSGNDAATAIAQHVGGSESDFVVLMNKKAKEIGAKNTSYNNPRGSDGSTAYDLALIASYALDNPLLARVVSIYSYEYKELKTGDSRRVLNINIYALRGEIFEANGVKWGHTESSGHCLIASARRGDRYIITVVMNSDDHVIESALLLEYGFEQTYIPVRAVSLDVKGTIELDIGDFIDLKAVFTPEKPTERGLSWTSDKPEVATVSERGGRVRAVDYGTAVITVKTNCGAKTASVSVRVPYTKVKKIEIDIIEAEMTIGEVIFVTHQISPTDATNKKVTWSSNNQKSVTVNNGRITAVDFGEAVITVTSECGNKSASVRVSVPYIEPEEIVLAHTDIHLRLQGIGDKKFLSARVYPENTTNKSLIWLSEDDTVVSVNQRGLLVAKGEGEAFVTVKTVDGDITESCLITVFNDSIIYGDVNNDGVIDVTDAILVLRYIVNLYEFEDEILKKAASVNGEDEITVEDAILILRYVVGLY